jgi:hypothetical protein
MGQKNRDFGWPVIFCFYKYVIPTEKLEERFAKEQD